MPIFKAILLGVQQRFGRIAVFIEITLNQLNSSKGIGQIGNIGLHASRSGNVLLKSRFGKRPARTATGAADKA